MNPDVEVKLREMEAKTLKIITALEEVEKSPAWSSLKEEVFQGLVVSLKKDLLHEAKQEKPDTEKLNRLAGKLEWAEKYADLNKLAETHRLELTRIRKQLHG